MTNSTYRVSKKYPERYRSLRFDHQKMSKLARRIRNMAKR